MKTDKLTVQLEEILRHIGEVLLQRRSQGAINGVWEGAQLKTDTDIVAEQIIVDALGKLSEAFPVVTEEDVYSHDRSQLYRYWLVDPIDGTASYSGGYSGFVSQIALMENGQPMLAAIYAPELDRMYLAEHGGGATVNGDKMFIIRGGLERIVLIDNYPQPQGVADKLYRLLGCHGYVESGSIGLKICRVADGVAELFVKDVTVRDWDIAPGHLVLREAGGTLCDLAGNSICYQGSLEKNHGIVAASSQALADCVVGLLAGSSMK